LMTTVKAGYGVVSLMPRQPFDWAGRTGTLEVETNVYGFGREWWDVYILPEDEMLLEIVTNDEGGTGERFPERAVRFSFRDGKPSVALIDNYDIVHEFTHWQRFQDAFPSDPAVGDPRVRRTFRMQLSESGWGFAVEKQDGTFWSFTGQFPQRLTFSRGQARVEHHAYNPTKDGIQGTPWSQYTYHWDNLRFDGPVLPARPAFEPGPHFVDLFRAPDPSYVSPAVVIDVPVAAEAIREPVLVGHLASNLNRDEVDFRNTSHWRQVRVNGGAWQDIPLVKNAPSGVDRSWSTFRVPVSGVVPGANRIEFRYPVRPPQATWHRDGFRVKDLEIQLAPTGTAGAAVPAPPPATPTAPASPSPTQTPVATPSTGGSDSTPPASTTLTFDDKAGQNQALDGQYPSGVIDWGSGQWYHSAPWGAFTSKSISFSGSGVTSRALTFLAPRRLVSLRAHNGGSGATTVTLSCAGQPAKQATVAAGQAVTIATGWTGTCGTVTLSSSNGWDTNFDDLVVDGGAAAAPTATTVPPSPSPTATSTPVPTATATAPASSPTRTVTFDDKAGQNQPLGGQYPSQEIDWGSGQWYHAGPWGKLTTKSISFSGSGVTSRALTFLAPRRLVSVDAYNGGSGSTIVTLSCAGQPAKSVTLAAGQLATITTGWTGTCSTVTLSSSNGWDTNFDSFVIADQ
ncbi:MAG: hypothetical protein ACRDJN_20060, partial [Chloroflexota bacterium]